MTFSLFLAVTLICVFASVEGWKFGKGKKEAEEKKPGAVVTLISGKGYAGYVSGAQALGQSIQDVGSDLELVAMVTADVPEESRRTLSMLWQVVEVETVVCNHKHELDATQYDLKGEKYQQGLARWSTTCTKFQAWNQVQYERVIFMDADMLVVGPIDDALWGFSNASFAAAPESFPPDTFNAGFMVLTPSTETFQKLLRLNAEIGSTEGGDQGVLNNGLCPQWFTNGPDDPECGRLPWLFNVEVVQYVEYKTLRTMNKRRVPSVIHFVSDGKPWTVLLYEYQPVMQHTVDVGTMRMLGKQAMAHLQWRDAFFRASGAAPSNNAFLLRAVMVASGQVSGGAQQRTGALGISGVEERDREAEIDYEDADTDADARPSTSRRNKRKKQKGTRKRKSKNALLRRSRAKRSGEGEDEEGEQGGMEGSDEDESAAATSATDESSEEDEEQGGQQSKGKDEGKGKRKRRSRKRKGRLLSKIRKRARRPVPNADSYDNDYSRTAIDNEL